MKLKTVAVAASLAVSAAFTGGCVGSAPVEGPKSPLVATWKAPLTISAPADFGSKVGRATCQCYAFGLVSSGDMSVKTAADAAGIKTVKHVDYEYKNVFLFAYQEITTIVYGD